jgi:hypothetical protein
MDEIATVATAVETPLVRIAPGTRIRRYRRVTAVSGVVLFVCMFMPAVDACGPVSPYQVPPVLPPYIYGLVFALIALSQTPRALRSAAVALRAISIAVAILGGFVMLIVPEIGVLELGFGATVLLLVGVSRTTEPRMAVGAIAVAAVASLWFTVWCFDRTAMFGVYASLASSLGLLVGAVLWRREVAQRPADARGAAGWARRGEAA